MTTLEAALQMGVNPRWAIVTRLAYLGPRISVLEKALGKLDRKIETLAGKGSINTVMRRRILQGDREELCKRLRPLRVEFQQLQRHLTGKPERADAITPDRIEAARNFPIASLLDQIPRGSGQVVCCPFHQDKQPSASVKHNVLICFTGCVPKKGGKGWDPIALLMERDGFSFADAVRQLACIDS